MSLLSAIGITSGPKVRYAIVALGDIAQEAMLPGVATQVQTLAAQRSPELVNTSSPAKGVDKTPKN